MGKSIIRLSSYLYLVVVGLVLRGTSESNDVVDWSSVVHVFVNGSGFVFSVDDFVVSAIGTVVEDAVALPIPHCNLSWFFDESSSPVNQKHM